MSRAVGSSSTTSAFIFLLMAMTARANDRGDLLGPRVSESQRLTSSANCAGSAGTGERAFPLNRHTDGTQSAIGGSRAVSHDRLQRLDRLRTKLPQTGRDIFHGVPPGVLQHLLKAFLPKPARQGLFRDTGCLRGAAIGGMRQDGLDGSLLLQRVSRYPVFGHPSVRSVGRHGRAPLLQGYNPAPWINRNQTSKPLKTKWLFPPNSCDSTQRHIDAIPIPCYRIASPRI